MHFSKPLQGSKSAITTRRFNRIDFVVIPPWLKRPCILLNKNINFNKNETESKMENPTHSFRETDLVLQLI